MSTQESVFNELKVIRSLEH
jgi:serine/threonine protein kinase